MCDFQPFSAIRSQRLPKWFACGRAIPFTMACAEESLDRNINSISTDYIDTKDLSYRNVKVGNVTFDFACEKKRVVYAYYDITPGGKLTQKLWKEIESSTTKDRPFYENEYIICTINRVPDSYWTLSTKYDNVHIVPLKSLFATYNKVLEPGEINHLQSN